MDLPANCVYKATFSREGTMRQHPLPDRREMLILGSGLIILAAIFWSVVALLGLPIRPALLVVSAVGVALSGALFWIWRVGKRLFL